MDNVANNVPKIVCLKIGGKAAADVEAVEAMVREIAELSSTMRFIVVHGGGAEVTRLSERLGLSPTFTDGVRMTSAEEMGIVDMVLAGKINKSLVRRFHAAGRPAAGLSGSDGAIFTGRRLNDTTHTGTIDQVDTTLLKLLLEHLFLPVVASTSMTKEGVALNINADEAAFAIAGKLPADDLVFLSDIDGVLTGDGAVIDELTEAEVARAIEDGTISGGMIPKMRASLDALRAGVGRIAVGRYACQGDLRRLLRGESGTRVFIAKEATPKRNRR